MSTLLQEKEHLGYRMIALEVDDMQKTTDYLRTKGVDIVWGPRSARPTQGRRSAIPTATTSSSGSGSGEGMRKRQASDPSSAAARSTKHDRHEGRRGSDAPVYADIRVRGWAMRPRSSIEIHYIYKITAGWLVGHYSPINHR